MRRIPVVLLALACIGGTTVPALAAPKPKPIQQQVPYTDRTPDYSGWAIGPDSHCAGLLPREAPHEFRAPAAGRLTVSISGFSGEWALDLRDAKGQVLAESDVPGGFETLTIKVRKPGVINIAPCNLAGTTSATISLTFTYS